MKIRIPIAASAVALATALALAGCSSGGLAGGSSTNGGSAKTGSSSGGSLSGNTGPTASYSANDLVTILKKTEAARNLTGTIKDNSEIKADQKSLTGTSLTQSLTAAGGKIAPASCGTLLDNLVTEGAGVLAQATWTSASLDATDDIINVGASSNTAEAVAVLSKVKGVMDQLTSQCSTMKIQAGTTSVSFTIKPASFSTDASTTFGYEEDVTLPGTKTVEKTLTIEALYGNLFIGDVELQNANASNLEANVNAVVAAAKG